MRLFNFLILVFSVAVWGACNSESNSGPDLNFAKNNGDITLPDGFKATVVAEGVGQARHITVDNDGDIYVALDELNNGKGIAALRDQNNDGRADITKYFGEHTGTGIQYRDGYLYASSDTSVMRYKLNSDLVPSGLPETIIKGFPEQNSHAAKSFTFDQSGSIYVNVGAPSNACQEESRTPESPGMNPCPQLEQHAGIWQFDADEKGQVFPDDGQRYATGIRNAVALDWNNNVDQLYVAQHGRDQLNTLWPDHFNAEQNAALPAEELFLVNKGDDFGWPYAYYDQQKEQKMVSPEYGGDGKTPAEQGKYEDPIMAFPGHWAPNDIIFYEANQFPSKYNNGALIAFHGSWNRAPEPQQGYKVVFVPFDGETTSGVYEEFADGFAGTDSLETPSNAKYRPMGLAVNTDGTLYITDSQQGKIWRIAYTN
jgi:glucose/arabinose dehydrogenase